MPLDPHLAGVLRMLAEAGRKPTYKGTPQEARAGYFALTVGTRKPAEVVPVGSVEDAVVDGAAGPLEARIYRPEGAGPHPTVCYFHGGGFVIGSLETHDNTCRELCRGANVVVVSVDYRLAPEHPFPAALEDALVAYRALLAGGVSPSSIVIAGDSAGGNLALSLLLALRDAREPLPAAAVLISPWVDLTQTGGSMQANEAFDWASPWMFERWTREYLQGGDPSDPRASPALANLAGLPPLLIQIGTCELLLDQVLELAGRARNAGVDVTLEEYPDLTHLWHSLTPLFPRFQGSMDRIGDFVRARSREKAAEKSPAA